MTVASTDRIEKQVVIKAPRARVWDALADTAKFGEWFGVELPGEFVSGARLSGRIKHEEYKGVPFEITVERVEPEHVLSWRWHPNSVERDRDYGAEPTTLVAFELRDVQDGTLLIVVESGFDAIPLERRAAAYRGNDEGWAIQVQAIERYVESGA
jgi:uncharacterized protein YndB with AHSA1/START domain